MDYQRDSAQNNHVDEESDSHPTRSSLVFAPAVVPPGHVKISVKVPTSEIASQIVGTKGVKIRYLREATGTTIISPFPTDEPIFTIIGLSENVKSVKTVIEDTAEHFLKLITNSKRQIPKLFPERTVIKFYMPRSVGLILHSPGGVELIRVIEHETQTRILQPSYVADPCVFKIIGEPMDANNAKYILSGLSKVTLNYQKATKSVGDTIQILRNEITRCVQQETANLKKIELEKLPSVECIDQNARSLTTEQVTTPPEEEVYVKLLNVFNSCIGTAEMDVKLAISFLEELDEKLKCHLSKLNSIDLLSDVSSFEAVTAIEKDVTFLSTCTLNYQEIFTQYKELQTAFP